MDWKERRYIKKLKVKSFLILINGGAGIFPCIAFLLSCGNDIFYGRNNGLEDGLED